MDAEKDEKFDILVIGSAMIDMFIFPEEAKTSVQLERESETLQHETQIAIGRTHADLGGGGANCAVGIARHGLRTALLTKLGNDAAANIIFHRLREEGVDISYLKTGTLNTGVSIIMQGINNDRTVFIYRGTNAEVTPKDIPQQLLQSAKWILMNGLDGNANLIFDVVKRASSYDTNIALSLRIEEIRFQGARISTLLPYISLLVLNKTESSFLYHTLSGKIHSSNEACTLCNADLADIMHFFKGHGVRQVCTTLGSERVLFLDQKNRFYQIPSKQSESINTTGMGDAFFSGLLSSIIMGKEAEEAVRHGIDNTVSVMAYLGAQIGLLKQ